MQTHSQTMHVLCLLAMFVVLVSASSDSVTKTNLTVNTTTAARGGGGGTIEVKFVEYKNTEGILADDTSCKSSKNGCEFKFEISFRVGVNRTTWKYEYTGTKLKIVTFKKKFMNFITKSEQGQPLFMIVSSCPMLLWYNVTVWHALLGKKHLADNFTGTVELKKENLNNWENVSISRANNKDISLTFQVRSNTSDFCFATASGYTVAISLTVLLIIVIITVIVIVYLVYRRRFRTRRSLNNQKDGSAPEGDDVFQSV